MHLRDPRRPAPGASLDELALALQELRAEAGHPSYAEIALRIARQRESRGVPREEARPGRTTVYDAFRTGRRRIDSELVVEIVRALGGSEDDCVHWATACRRALQGAQEVRPVVREEEPAATAAPAAPAIARLVAWRPSRPVLLGILLACLVVNIVGRLVVKATGIELHFDMIGTAFAAIVLGPWWGALVGLSTNSLAAFDFIDGINSLAFIHVNVAGALLWGYGVRSFGMGRSIPRFFVLTLGVGVLCSMLAAPVVTVLRDLGGFLEHGQDRIAASLREQGWSVVGSTFGGNLLSNVMDKVVAGFLSLTVVESLPRTVRAGLQHMGPPRS